MFIRRPGLDVRHLVKECKNLFLHSLIWSWKWDRGAGRYTTPGIHLLLLTFNVFSPHISSQLAPVLFHIYWLHLQLHCISACHRPSVNAYFVRLISPTLGTLALLDFGSRATVVAQAFVVLPLSNSGFSESPAWIHAKIYRKLPIHHISRHFFFFFQNFHFSHNFHYFFFFRLSFSWESGHEYQSPPVLPDTLIMSVKTQNMTAENGLLLWLIRQTSWRLDNRNKTTPLCSIDGIFSRSQITFVIGGKRQYIPANVSSLCIS